MAEHGVEGSGSRQRLNALAGDNGGGCRIIGTACPTEGSPASLPTARHKEMDGQLTAVNIAAPPI